MGNSISPINRRNELKNLQLKKKTNKIKLEKIIRKTNPKNCYIFQNSFAVYFSTYRNSFFKLFNLIYPFKSYITSKRGEKNNKEEEDKLNTLKINMKSNVCV